MQDLTGQKLNRLTVIKFSHYDKKKNSYWLCKCDCGNEKVVRRSHLLSGGVQSCGCVLLEGRGTYKNGWRTHGLWANNKRLCKIWNCMLDRCYNKNNEHHKHYGQRGIIICDEWKNNFENFVNWAMANGYAENLTIDRIDVNGNYCPENCRWVTMKEQANNKRNNNFLTYNGKTQTIAQWSKELNIKRGCLEQRYHKGWKVEDIFNPVLGFSNNWTFITYNNETKSITAWAKELHIHADKLKGLLKNKTFGEIYQERLTSIK